MIQGILVIECPFKIINFKVKKVYEIWCGIMSSKYENVPNISKH